MKFSNKSFKIQAKISLPVFILMGSVCRLGAMEPGGVDELGGHVGRLAVSTLISKKSTGSSLEDTSHFSTKVFSGSKVVDANEQFSPEFKRNLRTNRSKMFGRGDWRKPSAGRGFERRAVGRSSSVQTGFLQVQEKPKSPGTPGVDYENAYRPHEKHGYVSPSDGRDIVNPSNTGRGKLCYRKTSLHRSPAGPTSKSPVRSKGHVVEEVLSLNVRAVMERDAAVDSVVVQYGQHGQRLDFSDGFAEELPLVHGDDVLSLSQPGSILTASSNDEITLHVGKKDVKTSIKEVTAKPVLKEANKVLTYWGYHSDCLGLDAVGRKKYLQQLLDQDDLPGQSIDTAWPFLEEQATYASHFVPTYFESLVLKQKISAALIEKIRDASSLMLQQSSILRNQNQALMQSLRHAFSNSELSEMFAADSTEMIRFDTSEWSPTQFSQCLQLIVNQYIGSQKANAMLTQNNQKLSGTIGDLSDRQEKLTDTAHIQSQTIALLSREKSELESELRSMRAEQIAWRQERLTLQHANEQLMKENERLKSGCSSAGSTSKSSVNNIAFKKK